MGMNPSIHPSIHPAEKKGTKILCFSPLLASREEEWYILVRTYEYDIRYTIYDIR